MRPEESREFTARMQEAALLLLEMDIYRKPDDLARRFGLPVPVVRYWWRNTDEKKKPVEQSKLSPREVKVIRKATQTLENWEKVKRYRPECGAKLLGGKRCKRSVAIRPPEGWESGAMADRCRIHGGLSRRPRKQKPENDDD
jgi:DNA-binding transcriptional regulator YiaG